jgi:hypothetical protein
MDYCTVHIASRVLCSRPSAGGMITRAESVETTVYKRESANAPTYDTFNVVPAWLPVSKRYCEDSKRVFLRANSKVYLRFPVRRICRGKHRYQKLSRLSMCQKLLYSSPIMLSTRPIKACRAHPSEKPYQKVWLSSKPSGARSKGNTRVYCGW